MDLAVAFRSIPRRLREAQGDAPADMTSGPTAELHGELGEAARLLGVRPEPEAIADAIQHRPADEWDDATLDRLRQIALDAGRYLRNIGDAAQTP